MTSEEISALLRELNQHERQPYGFCNTCDQWWPCDGVRAADAMLLGRAVA